MSEQFSGKEAKEEGRGTRRAAGTVDKGCGKMAKKSKASPRNVKPSEEGGKGIKRDTEDVDEERRKEAKKSKVSPREEKPNKRKLVEDLEREVCEIRRRNSGINGLFSEDEMSVDNRKDGGGSDNKEM